MLRMSVVRRVTLVNVNIGLDEVVVVIHTLFRSHLFVNCCIRRYSLYTSLGAMLCTPPTFGVAFVVMRNLWPRKRAKMVRKERQMKLRARTFAPL